MRRHRAFWRKVDALRERIDADPERAAEHHREPEAATTTRPEPERTPEGALRFPADVLPWTVCPRCSFKRVARPGHGCPMC